MRTRWVIIAALLLGLATAALVAAGAKPADRSFAELNRQVQSTMSLLTPLLGILLVNGDRRRAPWELLKAVAIAVFGVLVSVAAAGTREHILIIALGSVLVQVVAFFVGTGLGLLLRSKSIAFLATVVVPLGLWFLLGAVDVLRDSRDWLTPLASVGHLLSGSMNATAWAQWLVMVLIWVAGLNALGAAIRRRRERTARQTERTA